MLDGTTTDELSLPESRAADDRAARPTYSGRPTQSGRHLRDIADYGRMAWQAVSDHTKRT